VQAILETQYPAPAARGGEWARAICQGHTWGPSLTQRAVPRYEWMPILNLGKEVVHDNKVSETVTGVSGIAVVPPDLPQDYPLSESDVPFVHPFGFDFEFLIVPDARYDTLLAPSNQTPKNDEAGRDYFVALKHAKEDMGLKAESVAGVLGVEIEQDLVPLPYRLNDGDRVAVFGRWIVDAGHSDFHSEIHPPLLLASARSISATHTSSTVIGRAYLVSQEFHEGNLWTHLLTEVKKRIGWPGTCKFCIPIPFDGNFCIPLPPFVSCSTRMEAHPAIRSPFSGHQHMSYMVRTPSPPPDAGSILMASFHFTTRSGISVRLSQVEADTVQVDIDMDDQKYKTPPPPVARNSDWSIPDLLSLVKGEGGLATFLSFVLPPTEKIRGDRRHLPPAPAIQDNQLFSTPAQSLPGSTPVTVDDHQPYPVFGRLDLEWQQPVVIQ